MDQAWINDQEWVNPDNWSESAIGGLYFSKRDSRVWVPKRGPAPGWTVNLAQPAGAVRFVTILLAPSAVLLIVLFIVLVYRG